MSEIKLNKKEMLCSCKEGSTDVRSNVRHIRIQELKRYLGLCLSLSSSTILSTLASYVSSTNDCIREAVWNDCKRPQHEAHHPGIVLLKERSGRGYPLESILEICGDGWGCHGDGGELLLEFHARHPMEHGALLYKEEFLCSMPVSNVPLDIHVGRTPIYNELSLDLTPFYI